MTSICIVGNDPTMVTDALRTTVTKALGELDPSFALEEFDGHEASENEDFSRKLSDALMTVPFLTGRRIIAVRNANELDNTQQAQLLEWMASPTPDVTLILGINGKPTSKLIKGARETVDVTPGKYDEGHRAHIREKFLEYSLSTSAQVIASIADLLGEEVSRVDGLARTLRTIYGSSNLTWEQIEPYLGQMGDVAPWDLTDEIAKGETSSAIEMAHRMMSSGGRSGIEVLSGLRSHFLAVATLCNSRATNAVEAGEIVKAHKYVAGKQLIVANQLGTERINACVHLIAEAELNLKGGMSFGKEEGTTNSLTELVVIEVLVARLARHALSARRR